MKTYNYPTKIKFEKGELKFETIINIADGFKTNAIKIRDLLVEKGIEEKIARMIAQRTIGTANYNPRIQRHRECENFGFKTTIDIALGEAKEIEKKPYVRPVKKVLREVEELNGMAPSEALDTIKDYVVWAMEQGLAEEERASDAIKRLQLLIEEAK